MFEEETNMTPVVNYRQNMPVVDHEWRYPQFRNLEVTATQRIFELDLSFSGINCLPLNLKDLFPSLKTLRLNGCDIKYITCDLPSTLRILNLDQTPVRYISEAHIPKRYVSLHGCHNLKELSLTAMKLTNERHVFGDGVVLLSKKVLLPVDIRQNIASRKIQRFMRTVMRKQKAARTIQCFVIDYLYKYVFGSEDYFYRKVLPDVMKS